MNRRYRLLQAFLGLGDPGGHRHCGAGHPRQGAQSSTTAISVGDATFHTQVQWDPVARKCSIRWDNAPAAALTFTQQWFVGEATPIVDFKAQPPRKLSAHEIVWVEESKLCRVRLEYALRAEDAIRMLAWASCKSGGKPLTLRWQQQIEGFPAGGTLFAPSPQGLYPLARQDVSVGYRDGAEQLSIPMATWFQPQAGPGAHPGRAPAMPTAGFRSANPARPTPGLTLSRRIPNLTGKPTVRPLFPAPRGRLAAPRWLGSGQKFPSILHAPRSPAGQHPRLLYLLPRGRRKTLRRVRPRGTAEPGDSLHLFPFGKYFPDEQPWIKAIDDKWSVVKKTTDPAAPRKTPAMKKSSVTCRGWSSRAAIGSRFERSSAA